MVVLRVVKFAIVALPPIKMENENLNFFCEQKVLFFSLLLPLFNLFNFFFRRFLVLGDIFGVAGIFAKTLGPSSLCPVFFLGGNRISQYMNGTSPEQNTVNLPTRTHQPTGYMSGLSQSNH